MKSVFLIATDFPPLAGTNVQRTQGFVATLPQLGWRPEVVTKAISDLPLIDSHQLPSLPPDLQIHRVPDPHPEAWLQRRKEAVPRDLAGEATRTPPRAARRIDNLALTALLLAVRPLISTRLSTPDASRLWAAAAARYMTALIQRKRRDAVVSSSPAYSCHLAGLAVKKRTGVPWVADFTDLWVGRPGSMAARIGWQARTDARMEADVVRHADRIIVASPPWKDRLGHRYGPAIHEKIRCVTLGYDSTKLRPASGRAGSGPLTFVCTGAMYGTESPVPFLDALGVAMRGGEQHVHVKLIGSAGTEREKINQAIERNVLGRVVTFMGPQPHERCMEEQANADVLLLFNGPAHVETIRGRSYEYMASGKPILAITPARGAQADILRPTRTALIIDCDDHQGLVAAIRQLLDPSLALPEPDWNYIRAFDAESITKQLVKVLDEVAP